MFGLTVEEATLVCDVWPDNWLPLRVFEAMSTQWRRAGMSGAIVGLDYGVLPEVMRLSGVARSRWNATFQDVRVMESAVLKMLRERK